MASAHDIPPSEGGVGTALEDSEKQQREIHWGVMQTWKVTNNI